MTCTEFRNNLQTIADGSTKAVARQRFEKHAKSCTACRELNKGFSIMLRAFNDAELPQSDLTGRILSQLEPARTPSTWSRRLKTAAAIATVAALVLIAVGWLNSTTNTHDSNTVVYSDDYDGPLFPEHESNDVPDASELLRPAFEPLDNLFAELERSIKNPVRPIATAATRSVEEFIKDIPLSESPMMMPIRIPGLGPPAMKKAESPEA